jgi:hypothetical protein
MLVSIAMAALAYVGVKGNLGSRQDRAVDAARRHGAGGRGRRWLMKKTGCHVYYLHDRERDQQRGGADVLKPSSVASGATLAY